MGVGVQVFLIIAQTLPVPPPIHIAPFSYKIRTTAELADVVNL